jgi:hypothetical protein
MQFTTERRQTGTTTSTSTQIWRLRSKVFISAVDSGHELNDPGVLRDRYQWLVKVMGIKPGLFPRQRRMVRDPSIDQRFSR